MDDELSKLKDKWTQEFNDLSYLSEHIMCMWTIDYINLNNNVYISIDEACENLIQLEREIFEMKIKQEIVVPPYSGLHFWMTQEEVGGS